MVCQNGKLLWSPREVEAQIKQNFKCGILKSQAAPFIITERVVFFCKKIVRVYILLYKIKVNFRGLGGNFWVNDEV